MNEDWTRYIPADPDEQGHLQYHGEDDPRSRIKGENHGRTYEEFVEWEDQRPAHKFDPKARAWRKARWYAEREAAERARIEKALETDPDHIADMHALARLADEWIDDEHT